MMMTVIKYFQTNQNFRILKLHLYNSYLRLQVMMKKLMMKMMINICNN